MRSGRIKTLVAGFAGIAFLGFLLLMSWRAGNLDETDVRNAALAGGVLVAVVGYLMVVGRGRVEIETIGNRLQIRAWPSDVDYGGSVELDQIDHLQVEKDVEYGRDKYRVQIVGRNGYGLLPPLRALSAINTQDEATAIGASIAQLFSLKWVPGVQLAATLSPSLIYVSTKARLIAKGVISSEGAILDPFLPVNTIPGKVDGKIRIDQTNEGKVVSYAQSLVALLSLRVFAAIWLAFNSFLLFSFYKEWGFGGAWMPGLFLIIGIIMLGAGFSRDEMFLEGDQLVHRFRVGPVPVGDKRISMADVEKVGTVVAWDSYNNMFFRVVAQAKLGGDFVLIKSLPEADGHALCQALHKHLGLPVGN